MKYRKFILVLSSALLLASCGGGTSSSSQASFSSEPQGTSGTTSSSQEETSQQTSEPDVTSEEQSSQDVKKYKVSFDLNGGTLPTGELGIADQYVEEGRWAVKPLVNPIKRNSTFLYWAYDGDKFNFTTQIFGDLNLVATYRVNEEDRVTLTFDPANGEPTFTIETFLNDVVSPRIPSKSGMVFKGWFLDGNESKPFNGYVSEEVVKATKIVALYAKEEFNLYFQIQEDQSIMITGISDRDAAVLSIPDNIDGRTVTSIKEGALGSLTKLKQVYLPASVRDLSARAFLGSYALTDIFVDGSSNYFKSVDGVLFNRNGSELVYFPPEKATSYTIPSGVRKIGDCAFYSSNNYSSLTTITFPEGLEEIGDRAFYNQKYISNFTFPSTLRKIGSHAFMMFDSATQVTVRFNEGLEEIGDSAFFGIYIKDILALPDTVKKIGEYAFAGLNAITAVVLPASLEEIGQAAFFQDYGISQIQLPSGNPNYVVSNNILYTADMKTVVYVPSEVTVYTKATDLVIPEGVTALGAHAFSDVRYVAGKIILPSTLETIGASAFHYNHGISKLEIPANVKRIEHDAFDQCSILSDVTLPEGLEFIGEYAFSSCTALKSIEIPGSVKIIDQNAFAGTPLSTLTLNEGLEEIGASAFYYYPDYDDEGYGYGSSSLASLTFPSTLKKLGDAAFGSNSTRALKSVTFKGDLEEIGEQPFYNCPLTTIAVSGSSSMKSEGLMLYTKNYEKLLFASSSKDGSIEVHAGCKEIAPYACYGVKGSDITLPDSLEKIGDGAFASSLTYGSDVERIINIPTSVKSIGNGAFRFANNIKTLVLNEGLESIGDEAFTMTDITALSIPNTVKSIGKEAFRSCYKLASLTLGSGLESIGDEAFFACYGLSGEMHLPASLVTLGEGVFAGNNSWAYGNGNALTDFIVDSGNEAFVSENGILFDANKTKVYAAASNLVSTTITLPETVTSVGNYGLANLENVTSLNLPTNLVEIGNYGLSSSTKIANLHLPKKTLGLGERVFEGWMSTQTITISYTKEFTLKYFPRYWTNSSNAQVVYGVDDTL